MRRPGVLALPLILAAAGLVHANPAEGDPRKEQLFSMFIAPCCWRENLLVHHSPKADELRAEIVQMVSKGKTDDEIKAVFIAQHSRRILAFPEGARGQWLTWTPPVALAAGLLAIALFIRRSRRSAEAIAVATSDTAAHTELPDQEWI